MQQPALVLLVFGLLTVPSTLALAQTPTAAQQQAIRSNCVSSYRAHCSDVPTGGMEALVCLEKNVDSLSPSCKSAVEAVGSGSSSGASSTATSSSQETAPASSADDSASTSTTSASSDTATAPAAADATDAKADTTSADTSATTSSSASSTVTAAPPTETANEPKLTFRQEMALAAGSCAVDFRLFCPNLPVGHGNILFCLRIHGPRLAPACRDALVKAGVTF